MFFWKSSKFWPVLVCLAALSAGGCRCKNDELTSSDGTIEVPPELNFGGVYVGQTREKTFHADNRGHSTVQLAWGDATPFVLVNAPDALPAGGADVTVRFTATQAGMVTVNESFTVDASHALVIALKADVHDPPECPKPPACHTAQFNLDTEKCVNVPMDDGVGCDGQSPCVVDAVCHGGECVGQQRNCDDNDQCTLDFCDPTSGCSHTARECPGDGPCRAGYCAPESGCAFVNKADGTACADFQSCEATPVCMNGACVPARPPDGTTCADAEPYQPAGRCFNAICERLRPAPLRTTFDSLGGPHHDLILEPSGALSLFGWLQPPEVWANRPDAGMWSETARRCIAWAAGQSGPPALYCADINQQGIAGHLPTPARPTGWRYDIRTARPDLNAATDTMFMARVAAVSDNQLAAVFEAYPLGSTTGPDGGYLNTQCRDFYLVMLDANGNELSAQKLVDPFLTQVPCNHPHPYGIATDVNGDIYLAFSPTPSSSPPLIPSLPTMFFAFTANGQPKWTHLETISGGEIAIANGLIFPAKSDVALSTATGAPQSPVALFGRPVVTKDLIIPSPSTTAPTGSLTAYSTANFAPKWTATLPAGWTFTSGEIRLAQWTPSPTATPIPVLLTFSEYQTWPQMVAIRIQDGAVLWTVALDYPSKSPPQMVEAVDGMIALMEGSTGCGECDPPFAASVGTFHTFSVPGLLSLSAPWPGSWGGAGHDHHEDP